MLSIQDFAFLQFSKKFILKLQYRGLLLYNAFVSAFGYFEVNQFFHAYVP